MDDFTHSRIGFSEVIANEAKKNLMTAIGAALAMAVLILDTKTALAGGAEGVTLCLQTLIPSLFPFFLCSNLLTSALTSWKIPLLHPLGKLLRIPSGSESLVVVGLLGGYPVGAQGVAQAHRSGCLSDEDARRMMAFCSNAGPAFLFGIGARAFPALWMCWALWGIHMLSAVLVGLLTPGGSHTSISMRKSPPMKLHEALRHSVEVMGLVCGWVVIFRVILTFLKRWFLWLLPDSVQIALTGVLEIANGCCSLTEIGNIGLRFLLCSLFLGFGGLCVSLQTLSVADHVDTGLYLPGKLTQAAISLLLCIPMQLLLPESQRYAVPPAVLVFAVIICFVYRLSVQKIQNNSSIPAIVVV